eukprot:4265505-Pyramimonas_sp.AAC.1
MLRLLVGMCPESSPLVTREQAVGRGEHEYVDVEDGDFELEAGVRDAQPGGAAGGDCLKPDSRA